MRHDTPHPARRSGAERRSDRAVAHDVSGRDRGDDGEDLLDEVVARRWAVTLGLGTEDPAQSASSAIVSPYDVSPTGTKPTRRKNASGPLSPGS